MTEIHESATESQMLHTEAKLTKLVHVCCFMDCQLFHYYCHIPYLFISL